jgi:hypothetical protein
MSVFFIFFIPPFVSALGFAACFFGFRDSILYFDAWDLLPSFHFAPQSGLSHWTPVS